MGVRHGLDLAQRRNSVWRDDRIKKPQRRHRRAAESEGFAAKLLKAKRLKMLRTSDLRQGKSLALRLDGHIARDRVGDDWDSVDRVNSEVQRKRQHQHGQGRATPAGSYQRWARCESIHPGHGVLLVCGQWIPPSLLQLQNGGGSRKYRWT